jgi:mannosyl-oligosaccharide alpha-1,2-mannosidase
VKPDSFVPMVPLSHEKYVAAKIQEERLPPGYTKISSRDYRLRPEAIESVFIMYRLTGDESWRDKGWTMFNAIDKATRTEVANAGVKDVTSLLGEQQDTMESFWLAETLKYFYLLFSEPDLISLDDYVL